MQSSRSIWLLAALAIVGLVDSVYLSYSKITANPLVCDFFDGCNVVAASPHSNFLGVPLAFWGIAFYLTLLLLLWAVYTYPGRLTAHTLLLMSVFGALWSSYFVYVQLYIIQALCIYCLISAGVSVLFLAITALWYRSTTATIQSPEASKTI